MVRVNMEIIPMPIIPLKKRIIKTRSAKKIYITGPFEPAFSIQIIESITSTKTVEIYKTGVYEFLNRDK